MNRNEVIAFLNGLEERYAVTQWRIFGVDVWPLLKIKVFFLWFEKTEADKRGVKTSNAINVAAVNSFSAILVSCFHWLKFFIRRLKKSEFLFSGAMSHRVMYQGSHFNRYFDPMMDYIEEHDNGHPLLFEQSAIEHAGHYRSDRIFELTPLYALANVVIKLKYKKKVAQQYSNLQGLEACLHEIAKGIGVVNKKQIDKQLLYTIQTILVWAFIFDKIFNKVKPRYTFGLCYYSLKMFGMNVSAHRKGITSVDMQHGTQGALHVAYTTFRKVPVDGYTVLPKIFWCWDQTSANAITQWTNKQSFHTVMVGGNPWIELMRKQQTTYSFTNGDKKIIVMTLQPIEPLVDDYIIDAIKATVHTCQWWLRLHPRQLHDKPRLITLLKENGISDEVIIEEAYDYPLPVILQQASIHISKFSGAVIEAGLMGVPNIIIDEIGAASFSAEIEKGETVVFLDKEPNGLVQLIDNIGTDKRIFTMDIQYGNVLNQLI